MAYGHEFPPREIAEHVSFFLGKAVQVSLKFDPPGKTILTTRGERVMFTLTDERKMWLDPPEGNRITKLGIRAGVPFWIRKRKVSRNHYSWDIWIGEKGGPGTNGIPVSDSPHGELRVPQDAPPAPAWENSFTGSEGAETELERQLRESIEQAQRLRSQVDQEKAAREQQRQREAAEAERRRQAAAIERREPQSAGADRPGWFTGLVESTKQLTDALAEVRAHAERHGQRVSFDDCEKLLVTALIGRQRRSA